MDERRIAQRRAETAASRRPSPSGRQESQAYGNQRGARSGAGASCRPPTASSERSVGRASTSTALINAQQAARAARRVRNAAALAMTEASLALGAEELVVNKAEMCAFVRRAMAAAGASDAHAAQLAAALVTADERGHFSHGVNRLHIYIEDTLGNVAKEGEPRVLKRKGATAWVDGCNLLGPVVGNFCTSLAMELAREHGVGWVVCKGSNHFGSCGFYTQQMADAGLVGLAFTNTSPCMFPSGASEQALGSNPICCIANTCSGDSFALDMATSCVAYGKIEMAETCGAEQMPSEWGADASGRATTRPADVLAEGGGLLPLGGYKGSGLATMVEILCGGLGGTPCGGAIRSWRASTAPANLAHCFVAVDAECFAPGFGDRLQSMLNAQRTLAPLDPAKPPLVAGDPERVHTRRCAAAGGLLYGRCQINKLMEVAKKYNVAAFKVSKRQDA